MKLLIVQHETDVPAGLVGEWARERGIGTETLWAPDGKFPASGVHDGVIVLGGSMNVDEESKHPWLTDEKAFLRARLGEKRKTMGLCLGGQLIADVMGARVGKHPFAETGRDLVRVLPGLNLPGGGERFAVMQWHEYSFDIPDGAVRAFEGERWENQGFAAGNHAIAVQFHPEADDAFVERGYADIGTPVPRSFREELRVTREWFFRLLDSFFLPG